MTRALGVIMAVLDNSVRVTDVKNTSMAENDTIFVSKMDANINSLHTEKKNYTLKTMYNLDDKNVL